jgi:regulator of sigma E protease
MGHFFAAKMFKTRVEKFYLFFNPWFSIFKIKRGDTEYGMGWLPLGGYVKISGMIDESMDKEQLSKEPQPFEFRSKPAWQRLIIMLGGVTMNIILAIVIYIGMLTFWGDEYLPTSEVKYGIRVDSLGMEAGLRDGDKILSVDYQKIEDFNQITKVLVLSEGHTIQVERDGKEVEIVLPDDFLSKLVNAKSPLLGFRMPFYADRFTNNSAGKAAGMKEGDQIISINDISTPYFTDFFLEIQKHKNEDVRIGVIRESDTLAIPVSIPEAGKIGVYNRDIDKLFNFSKVDYNIAQAIPAGVVKAYQGVEDYLAQLRLLFSPKVKAYESVGGFITIGSIFPPTWDWEIFWRLTAFLSIMLAILNVLPIPALDGGHVMFLMYEIITRRKPSDKFMEYAQITGMVILFGLLIFANGNDIVKLFK